MTFGWTISVSSQTYKWRRWTRRDLYNRGWTRTIRSDRPYSRGLPRLGLLNLREWHHLDCHQGSSLVPGHTSGRWLGPLWPHQPPWETQQWQCPSGKGLEWWRSSPAIWSGNNLSPVLYSYLGGQQWNKESVTPWLTVVLGLKYLVTKVVALDSTRDPSEVLDTVSWSSGNIWKNYQEFQPSTYFHLSVQAICLARIFHCFEPAAPYVVLTSMVSDEVAPNSTYTWGIGKIKVFRHNKTIILLW